MFSLPDNTRHNHNVINSAKTRVGDPKKERIFDAGYSTPTIPSVEGSKKPSINLDHG